MAAAVAGLALGSTLIGGSAANADPKQFTAISGMGSDTTQDIFNAWAGNSNNISYLPISSTVATGSVQVASWDAFGTACITPKTAGVSVNRPAGSSAGRRMLSRAIDGGNWGNASCGASATGKPVAGLIQFARSSAPPSGVGTDLTYVPTGRDGLTFGYYRSGGGAVTTLTRAQLTTLFTSGPQVIGGVRIVPCGIQTGSGTKAQWDTTVGTTAGAEGTSTTECNAATSTPFSGRIEENNGTQLKAKGDSAAMTNSANCPTATPCQVIIGMSAGSFVAQSNNVSPSTMAGTNVALGAISDNGSGTNLGLPHTGTAPNLVPSSSFYADTTFGRTLYVVLDSNVVNNPGNQGLKNLFIGSGSQFCSSTAQNRNALFGFLAPADCGSTTLTGPLLSGNI